MGQIKNIKLHIVTDIKVYKELSSHIKQTPTKPTMSSFRPRSMFRAARNITQAVRGYASQQQSAYQLPTLLGGAVLVVGGTTAAAALYQQQLTDGLNFLPAVFASPPKTLPVAAPMERTFIMIKPDGVKRGLIA